MSFFKLFLFALLSIATANPLRSRAQPCQTGTFTAMQSLLPAGVTLKVEEARTVAAGGSHTEAGNAVTSWRTVTTLPSLCAAIISIKNTSATPVSSYRFGMFLPSTWNGRTLTLGSASFAGAINWPQMAEGVHYGMATISTDNGHSSVEGDLSWGFKNDSRLLDWGYRAIHGSVQVGKIVTKAFYQKELGKSYYSGCSTGGRQGLKEIQVDPTAFDGVLVGAPAWDTKYLMPHIAKMASDNLKLQQKLGSTDGTDLVNLQQVVYAACDTAAGLDEVQDFVIQRPDKCNITLALENARCNSTTTPPNCLTGPQVEFARSVYSDYITSDASKTFVQNGFLPGSENEWFIYLFQSNMVGFDGEYIRQWQKNDTSWQTISYTDDIALDSIKNGYSQATADDYKRLGDYQARGGKIIMYHGLADGIVPSLSSQKFYTNTQSALSASSQQMDSFFRYFQIPSMGHCYNGNGINVFAPWNIGGAFQATVVKGNFPSQQGWSVPGHQNDAKYDALAALIAWTEGTRSAPEQIVATNWNINSGNTNVQNPAVFRTRPICKYPKYANFTGTTVNDAASWTCIDR